MSSVVHCKRDSYDIYIGRPSKWGNPFSHLPGKGECQVPTREDAVKCYRQWIKTQPQLLADLHELKGKTLGCWCAPQACHGDVLVSLVKEIT